MPEDNSPLPRDVKNKFREWFKEPVSNEPSFSSEVDHLGHGAQSGRGDNLSKPSELLKVGFVGAVFLGIFVCFVVLFLDFLGRYNKNWLAPIFVISLAAIIGFLISLFIGFYRLRK